MEHLFPLVDRKEIAEETMEFTFDTTGSEYVFMAGQHTDYTLIDPPHTDAEGNTRTFSFVNAPGEHRIQIATRMRNTAFKNSLKEVPLGTKIQVKDSMGRFILHKDASKPAVFLIGGIGITPVMSIIKDCANRHDAREMFLFYSNRSLAATAFYDELTELTKRDPQFHFVPILTDQQPEGWTAETARIDAVMIKKYIGDPTAAVFYTSGPPMMVKAMVELIEGMGVPEEQLKTEDFAGY